MPDLLPDPKKQLGRRIAVFGLLAAFIPLEIGLVYFTERSDFPALIAWYLGLFVLYFCVLKLASPERDHKWILGSSILFRAILIFAIPELSDDFYRFIWDGYMGNAGYDVFKIVPCETYGELSRSMDVWANSVYYDLNSQGYYTVYPPLLQAVFRVAAFIFPNGADWEHHVPIMKAFIFLAEVGSIWVLTQLAKEWKMEKKVVWLYALNPLAIVELTGALHFEAFMIFFCLLGVLFLVKKKWYMAAPAFALAVGAKMLPLMFFPFLIRRLGWGKSIGFLVLSSLCILVLFFPMRDPEAMKGFLESVQLYFQTFEFNASMYYLMKWIFIPHQHYLYSKILSGIVAVSIFLLAFLEERPGMPKAKPFSQEWLMNRFIPLPVDHRLLQGMVIALTLYLLSATTVHPWYLVALVAFASLTKFRFPILWGILILFTYITYQDTTYTQSTAIMIIEYVLVYALLIYEWVFKTRDLTLEDAIHKVPLFKKWIARSIPKRVEIKIGHLLPHVTPADKVLDIGTGNGGICHALLKEGRNIQPLDIKNISFFPEVNPLVYDGKKLPFSDQSFDTALLITMLHHTPDPEAILVEARRVAPRLIVMEDIYSNFFQKYLTFFADSLVNLEFDGHPHTNRNDAGWRDLFDKLALNVVAVEYRRTLVFFKQVVYVLEARLEQ